MADLVKWEELRLPGTCQTMTDVDEATGELVLTILGVGPAPPTPPPADGPIFGEIVAGRVIYEFSEAKLRCILRNVELVDLQ